jgi:peptidoglycan/LPS O-acetylase OafA/YrhL
VGAFFALSGFLITTLLVEEMQRTGSVSLAAFYRRRALRLLPALAVMLAVVLLWDLRDGSFRFVRSAGVAALYIANYAHLFGVRLRAFGHTWSLAVEEHFYLLWPVVFLLLARRYPRRTAAKATLAIAACSTAVRVAAWAAGASHIRLQYGTDMRIDGLLIGCAAGLWFAGEWPPVPTWVAAAAVVALGALSFVGAHTAFMMTVGFVLLAVATVILVLHLLGGASMIRTVFENRVMVWLGRISYGVYLWHFPVIRLGRPYVESLPGPVGDLILAGVSIAIAQLSFRLIESRCLLLKEGGGFGRRRARWTRVAPAG